MSYFGEVNDGADYLIICDSTTSRVRGTLFTCLENGIAFSMAARIRVTTLTSVKLAIYTSTGQLKAQTLPQDVLQAEYGPVPPTTFYFDPADMSNDLTLLAGQSYYLVIAGPVTASGSIYLMSRYSDPETSPPVTGATSINNTITTYPVLPTQLSLALSKLNISIICNYTALNMPILPTAAFTAIPSTQYVTQPITFNASASTGGSDGYNPTTISDYAWDFGDGTPVEHNVVATTQHSYSTEGIKTVQLTVTDSVGQTNATTHQVVIQPLGETMADYTITGSGVNATATENVSPFRTTPLASISSILNTVLGWITAPAGKIVEFIGTFDVTVQIPIYGKNGTAFQYLILDFTQATMNVSGSPSSFEVRSAYVKFLNRRWIGPGIGDASGQAAAIRILKESSVNDGKYCVIDGAEMEQCFQCVFCAYESSYNTLINCNFHDNLSSIGGGYTLQMQGLGHHRIINCQIIRARGGIFFSDTSVYNLIQDCKFDDIRDAHAVYFDGLNHSVGHNEIVGCDFSNQQYQACIHMKSPNNKIHHNAFHDMGAGLNTVAISIYSEYSTAEANDNEIYNNTFTNLDMAIWLGHDGCAQPTVRNKFRDNVFTNVRKHCFGLNPWIAGGAWNYVDDTKIYYNDFHNCPTIFKASDGPASWIRNLVIAHNTFDPPVSPDEVARLKSYVNTMIYGNIGLEDYNPVTDPSSPYYIPPRTAATTLIISINDPSLGTTDPIPGTYEITQGNNVQISAIPSTGYMFDHWELDEVNVGSTSPYSVYMDTNHSILAVFVEIPTPPPGKHNITISATIGGTTLPEAGTWEFNEGVSIQVRANPDNNYSFDHWELDGVVSKDNPITITMDIDHGLLATFTAKPVPIPLWQVGTVAFSLFGVTSLALSKA